jgi:peptidoglycan-associated lipoprotein
MKRNLIIATLGLFLCSSIFLLSSCAKKQVVTEEKEIKAAPKEVAKVEKERLAAKEEEIERAERVKIERLKELESAKKREADAKKAWQARRSAKFEAESVYFDFDKSFIRTEYRPGLKKKAEFLKDNLNIHIRIEGNCDERGTNEYNLALGERRADSAKKFLVSLGISPDRTETISYGEERPLALGHNENSWTQNRRDDFVIIKK